MARSPATSFQHVAAAEASHDLELSETAAAFQSHVLFAWYKTTPGLPSKYHERHPQLPSQRTSYSTAFVVGQQSKGIVVCRAKLILLVLRNRFLASVQPDSLPLRESLKDCSPFSLPQRSDEVKHETSVSIVAKAHDTTLE
jgi:hypothetical protein